MDTSKSAQLEALVDTLQQKWGSRALQRAAKLNFSAVGLPTGFDTLDQLLGESGVPLNSITELRGKPTSGMTTLAYKIIHQAQRHDGYALYIDWQRTFDPDYAARCGLSLERLVVVHPDSDVQALDIAFDGLRPGRLRALALDLGMLPPERLLQRLNGVLAQSGCVLLVLVTLTDALLAEQITANTPPALRLLIERQNWLADRNGGIRGYQSEVTILKQRSHGIGGKVCINITFDGVVDGDGA